MEFTEALNEEEWKNLRINNKFDNSLMIKTFGALI